MKSSVLIFLLGIIPFIGNAADSIYCPQNHELIKIGMTADEVLSACGQPNSKHAARGQATKQVDVKQLIYTELNKGSIYSGLDDAFYSQWSLPSGSTGASLEIDIIDGKVTSIRVNGSSSNKMSLCQNGNINVGNPISHVYNACGSPSAINHTYINEPIPSDHKPQIWIYQADSYQPIINLTFVNGRLQSID